MALSHHLGLEISDNALRLVEVRMSDRFPIVLRCEVAECQHAFGSALLHRVPYEYALAKAFVGDIASLFHGRAILSHRISIVLPSTAALIATIPIDSGLGETALKEHLQWECRTLSGTAPDAQFQLFHQVIGRGNGYDTHLLAALPRETVTFLKSTLEHLTFEVTGIEIDHFLFETVIPRFYPEAGGKTIGVVGIAPPRCIASVSGADGYLGVHRDRVTRADRPGNEVLSTLHPLLLSRPDTALQTLFLYGPGATTPVEQNLAELLTIPVRAVHPARAVSYVTRAEEEKAAAHPAHTFDAALSAAIKGAA
jgi:Tfp pilus assembly PilM family ATPase